MVDANKVCLLAVSPGRLRHSQQYMDIRMAMVFHICQLGNQGHLTENWQYSTLPQNAAIFLGLLLGEFIIGGAWVLVRLFWNITVYSFYR